MSKKFIILLLAVSFLITDRALSMESKRKREEEKETQELEQKPKKIIKMDEEPGEEISESKETFQPLELSTLPTEIKISIIAHYIISSPYWKKIKSIDDIEKFIKRRSLALVNLEFRSLFFDPILKSFLIKQFVKDNPQEAVNDLLKYIRDDNIDDIKTLIKSGVIVNGSGNCPCGTSLICHINPSGSFERTPLQFSVEVLNPNIKIIQTLLTAGAEPNLISFKGDVTALHSIILNANVKPEIRDRIVLLLLQEGAFPNALGPSTTLELPGVYRVNLPFITPLLIAFIENYLNVIEYLLHYGADPFFSGINLQMIYPTKSSDPKAKLIFTHNYASLIFESLRPESFNTLKTLILNHDMFPNANINVQTQKGYTPLMAALKKRNIQKEIVSYLLEHGADPNIISNDNNTALNIVKTRRDLDEATKNDLINLLEKYNAQDGD